MPRRGRSWGQRWRSLCNGRFPQDDPGNRAARGFVRMLTGVRYATMSFGPATSRRLVRVLDVDPDLGQGLDAPDLDAAMRVATGELEVVEPGAWRPQRGTLYGGLVFEGLIVRELTLGASVSAELMGAGDVIAPWEGEEAVPFIPS